MKKPWWEKEWDSTFKELLSEKCIDMGENSVLFNEYAKQFIDRIVQKEIRDMTEKHNLVALSIDRSGRRNTDAIEKVEGVIKTLKQNRDESDKFIKKLTKILK